jgi:hypothetical protein
MKIFSGIKKTGEFNNKRERVVTAEVIQLQL